MRAGGLLNRQNLLSVAKVICRWFLKEKIAQTLFESKKIKRLKVQLGQITSTMNNFCCLGFFPIQQWLSHNNPVTDRGLNSFDDYAAECVGRV